VYLDLLGSWREALGAKLGRPARDGRGVRSWPGIRLRPGRQRGQRAGPAAGRGGAGSRCRYPTTATPAPGDTGTTAGVAVPSVAEGGAGGGRTGRLAEVTLTFPGLRACPRLGRRSYRLRGRGHRHGRMAEDRGNGDRERHVPGHRGSRAPAARSGFTDKRTGAEVLAGPGNELVIQDEYAQHPRHNEGPWHLAPKGPRARFGLGPGYGAPGALRSRLAPGGLVQPGRPRRDPGDRASGITADGSSSAPHVDSYGRARPSPEGALPPPTCRAGLAVYQTATAVIGRSFGVVDVDSADHWYTLDNPAYQWFGLGFGGEGHGPRRAGPGDRGGPRVVCPVGPNGLGDSLRDLLGGAGPRPA